MSEPRILVTKPKALSAADKKRLAAADIVVVETETPADVRLLSTEGPPMGRNDITFAAVQALASTADEHLTRNAKSKFVELLAKVMQQARG